VHGTSDVDAAPSPGTRIDAWVTALVLAAAHHEVAPQSETV
jgi:hypothetical protein